MQGFESLKQKVDVYATLSDLRDLESRLVDYAPVYKVIKIEEYIKTLYKTETAEKLD